MSGMLVLAFASFLFGGIYCTFTGRITLYCGKHDWWSLFFGVVFSFTVFIMNSWAQVSVDSFFWGFPFALGLVAFLYNMYITFKVNMLEGRGVGMSCFAAFFKGFIVTIAVILVLGAISKSTQTKKRRR